MLGKQGVEQGMFRKENVCKILQYYSIKSKKRSFLRSRSKKEMIRIDS